MGPSTTAGVASIVPGNQIFGYFNIFIGTGFDNLGLTITEG